MKKIFLFSLFFTTVLLISAVVLPSQALAQITNPAIGALGSNAKDAQSGVTFTTYFITLWRALIFVGGLAVLFNLVMGAMDWILAGGEQAKIQKGRDKITQSIVGMIVLAGTFVIITYVSQLFFNFDLLNLTIPSVDQAGQNNNGTVRIVPGP